MGVGGTEVGGGRGQLEAERGGVPGAEQRPGAAAKARYPLAPEPAELLKPDQSNLIDKAGNIRLDNIKNWWLEQGNVDPVTFKAMLNGIAQDNNNFIGYTRDRVTDGQLQDAAAASGFSVQDLLRRQVGEAYNDTQITVAQRIFAKSSLETYALMQRAKASNNPEDIIAYAQAKAFHEMIQGQFAGITAEAGRALRALRKLQEIWSPEAISANEFLKQATGKTLFQLKIEARLGARLDSSAKVSKFLQDAQKRSFGAMLLEYWINGLISGIHTHATYFASNIALTANNIMLVTPTAALVGKTIEALGRQEKGVRMSEALAKAKATWTELPAATQAFLEGARTNALVLAPGEETRPLMPFLGDTDLATGTTMENKPISWQEVHSYTSAMVAGLKDSALATMELVKAGGDPDAPAISWHYSLGGAIPNVGYKGIPLIPTGEAARLPSRMIQAIHSFFHIGLQRMELSALANRTADHEIEAGILRPEDREARVGDLRQNPPEEMLKQSAEGAYEGTLMGQAGKFVQWLQRGNNIEYNLPGLGPTKVLRFINPFIHIASQILKKGPLEMSPLGPLLSSELRRDVMGANGAVHQDTAIARIIVGSSLSALFMFLRAQGTVTGSGPTNPDLRNAWLQVYQPHSINIGNFWYPMNRLGPLGMNVGTAADIYDVATSSDLDFSTAAAGLMHAITQNILDESMMRGPAELMRAAEDSDRYGSQYVRNFLTTFVPYSVESAQLARQTDPYMRQARTITDALRNHIPGHLDLMFAHDLYARRDPLTGEPVANLPTLGFGLTSLTEKPVTTDKTKLAIVRLGIPLAPLERRINNVKLTDQEYDDFTRIAGKLTKMRLDDLVNSPGFDTWAPHVQRDRIEDRIKQNRETARNEIKRMYPHIISDALAMKRAKKLND